MGALLDALTLSAAALNVRAVAEVLAAPAATEVGYRSTAPLPSTDGGADLPCHRTAREPDRVQSFELPGALRRIRRLADLSQRELAARARLTQSAVAQAESGRRDVPVGALARAAAVAGLRLALLDADGREVSGMSADAVRDLGGRLFPAHLDTVHTDDLPGRYDHRLDRPRPSYAAGRDRAGRDTRRQARGTPEDHHEYRAGDSPAERVAARRRAALLRAREEMQRRFESSELRPVENFECSCPPACDELDDWSARPVHAENCPCSCDLG